VADAMPSALVSSTETSPFDGAIRTRAPLTAPFASVTVTTSTAGDAGVCFVGDT
jgi:hypothetical protein